MVPEYQITRVGKRFQIFSALRYSNFRWFWINGAAQAMAQGMQFLVLGLLVLDITGSSIQLGLVVFAYGTPNLAFAMLGVVIADRPGTYEFQCVVYCGFGHQYQAREMLFVEATQ